MYCDWKQDGVCQICWGPLGLSNKNEGLPRAKMKMFWAMGYIHYLDCGDGFIGDIRILNSKDYTLKHVHLMPIISQYCYLRKIELIRLRK